MRAPLRRRGLTETDRSEWAAYARLLTPLPGRAAPPMPPPAVTAPPLRTDPVPSVPPAHTDRRSQSALLAVGATPGGLDRGSWKRLRSGKLAPVRTLDLHGRTLPRAHAALVAFLQLAYAEQVRCVEVITGRGSGETGGAIRRELPHWLNHADLRPLVLAAVHPHPANQGAVRLLLRRAR